MPPPAAAAATGSATEAAAAATASVAAAAPAMTGWATATAAALPAGTAVRERLSCNGRLQERGGAGRGCGERGRRCRRRSLGTSRAPEEPLLLTLSCAVLEGV